MNRRIILFGAGRSSSMLLDYLISNASIEKWEVEIITNDVKVIPSNAIQSSIITITEGSVLDAPFVASKIEQSSIVISMLPASFHMHVASHCLDLEKNLITASYVSDEMNLLSEKVADKGLLFLNECGLDPGLDHMSAMRIIHEIQDKGGVLKGFESFTGGLVAPESDNNPWNYKFTWNPRNVILAGQGGTAMFIQQGTYKYIPYQKLFQRTERIEIEGYGSFEGYANRDSLKYRELYGLNEIGTLFRGTFRRPGFCKAWDCLIQLGLTDDSYFIEGLENMTYRDFTNLFLAFNQSDSVEIKLKSYLGLHQNDYQLWEQLKFIGLFESEPIGLKRATPAQVLQKLLETKWKLSEHDKDMIVMWHKFDYELQGQSFQKDSSMVVIGDDQEKTAMAITVGLPVGIATKLVLNGVIKEKGVRLPLSPSIYNPILDELEREYQIQFKERDL